MITDGSDHPPPDGISSCSSRKNDNSVDYNDNTTFTTTTTQQDLTSSSAEKDATDDVVVVAVVSNPTKSTKQQSLNEYREIIVLDDDNDDNNDSNKMISASSSPPESQSSSSSSVVVVANTNKKNSSRDPCGIIMTTSTKDGHENSSSGNSSSSATTSTAAVDNDKGLPKKAQNRFAKFARTGSSVLTITRKITKPAMESKEPVAVLPPPPKHAKKQRQQQRGTETTKQWIRVRDLPDKERQSVEEKWHSMIDNIVNDNYDCPDHDKDKVHRMVEERKFLILVAALLHAQCQEVVVRDALIKLTHTVSPFTVASVARLDPVNNDHDRALLHGALYRLQYHNSKARYIVQAARDIIQNSKHCRHQNLGTVVLVPEHETELRQLQGIGPVFADLLATVNTRKIHVDRTLRIRRCRQCVLASNGDNDDDANATSRDQL
jgi:endonuclease III